jgi:hypothetical protein
MTEMTASAPVDKEQLLTTEQLAERVQHTSEWVLNQIKFKGLPVIKFNRRDFRFHWPTVLAWLQQL